MVLPIWVPFIPHFDTKISSATRTITLSRRFQFDGPSMFMGLWLSSFISQKLIMDRLVM